MSYITQNDLNNIANNTNTLLNVSKKATKNIRMAVPGESITTYIDTGSVITEEVTRIVPTDGIYIVISDKLLNSNTVTHDYFISIEDFLPRYITLDNMPINSNNITYDYQTVKANGNAMVFEHLEEYTPTGLYEKPPSWGGDNKPASGAIGEGYWMASVQRPTEWYFVSNLQFYNDYVIV